MGLFIHVFCRGEVLLAGFPSMAARTYSFQGSLFQVNVITLSVFEILFFAEMYYNSIEDD
jgi:hypothetical protein